MKSFFSDSNKKIINFKEVMKDKDNYAVSLNKGVLVDRVTNNTYLLSNITTVPTLIE